MFKIIGHNRYVSNLGMRALMPTLTVMVKFDSQHRGLGNCSDVAKRGLLSEGTLEMKGVRAIYRIARARHHVADANPLSYPDFI